jgi:hypothetical protein
LDVPVLIGPYGGIDTNRVSALTDAGGNAVWFHGFDEQLFDLCAAHGLAPCVEFKTFRASFAEHPELVPIGVDGRPIRYGRLVQGVCLSKQWFLDWIEEELTRGVGTYRPRGVWFDYLTYGGWFETPDPDLQESCFCDECVAEFKDACDVDPAGPEEILRDYAEAWHRHKCERIAGFARRYREMVKSALPDAVVGAYMCPWEPDEHDRALTRIFAQDYARLSESIDVFTPLIYAKKSGRPPQWGRSFLAHKDTFVPGGSKVQLILDVLDYPDSLTETAASPIPSWGFQLFGGRSVFSDGEQTRQFARSAEAIQRTVAPA